MTPEQLAAELYPIASDDNRQLQELRRLAYIAGYNADRWVSIDTPPKVDSEVIIFQNHGDHTQISVVLFDDEEMRWCLANNITHWMPMPILPK